MLCTSEKPLGMIRVDADKVIIACNNTIRSIHEYRSDARRKYCNKWLTAANKSWQRFWRWFGFSKPVLRDALIAYYGPRLSQAMEDRLTYSLQEQDCKQLLRAAIATDHATMWVSTNGARSCKL